jgi:hypothetical protein
MSNQLANTFTFSRGLYVRFKPKRDLIMRYSSIALIYLMFVSLSLAGEYESELVSNYFKSINAVHEQLVKNAMKDAVHTIDDLEKTLGHSVEVSRIGILYGWIPFPTGLKLNSNQAIVSISIIGRGSRIGSVYFRVESKLGVTISDNEYIKNNKSTILILKDSYGYSNGIKDYRFMDTVICKNGVMIHSLHPENGNK